MSKALSLDLRTRVLAAIAGGLSCRQAAARLTGAEHRAQTLGMDLQALQQLLAAVAGVRVVTIGDVMVDRFVHGEVSRVSAEAPIPILARSGKAVMLGAAGNVARRRRLRSSQATP